MAVLLLLRTERLLRLQLHVALWDQHLLGFGELHQRKSQVLKKNQPAQTPTTTLTSELWTLLSDPDGNIKCHQRHFR